MRGEWRQLGLAALAAGWQIEPTTRHLAWLAPDGKTTLISSCTPGTARAYANHRARLRRCGLDTA